MHINHEELQSRLPSLSPRKELCISSIDHLTAINGNQENGVDNRRRMVESWAVNGDNSKEYCNYVSPMHIAQSSSSFSFFNQKIEKRMENKSIFPQDPLVLKAIKLENFRRSIPAALARQHLWILGCVCAVCAPGAIYMGRRCDTRTKHIINSIN